MSGALGPQDAQEARPEPRRARQRAAVLKITGDADHARAIEALKKRRNEALARERGEQITIPSSIPNGADIAKTTVEKVDEARTVERIRAARASRIQSTPALDASILGIANFKRRPRQPSILQLGRQEPQIHLSDEDEDEDLEGFHPHDESTPFHISNGQSHRQDTPTSSSTSSQQLPSLGSRKRKLTTPEVLVPRSQSPAVPTMGTRLGLPEEPVSDLYGATSDEGEQPTLPAIRTARAQSPQVWSDTMAPPQSSSPSQDNLEASYHTKSARATNQTRNKNKSSSRAPNATPTALSPLNPSSITKPGQVAIQASKVMTTAILQNLLPRRRRRPKRHAEGDGFDILSSSDVDIETMGLAEDEDELSFHAPVGRKKRGGVEKAAIAKGIAAHGRGKGKVKQAGMGAVKAVAKAKQAQKGDAKVKGVVKTYTRRASEKENSSGRNGNVGDGGGGVGENGTVASVSDNDNAEEEVGLRPPGNETRQHGEGARELKTLAIKFKEVDQWALDFEEVTASSSFPEDAR
ncbi:hypothetical protein MMC06_000862 [Schaereria dolodes]|nr:hypothetical protein [Schaereria dolodes]